MATTTEMEVLPKDCVLIAGGGPVGLLLALVLARHGQRSVLLERQLEPTQYPKMHLVLARTMEIFRHLGLADECRARGVCKEEPFTVRFSSGLAADKTITQWDLPSVEEFQRRIISQNDGKMPRDAWQRIPSNIMEPWLREKCENSPFVDARYGWKVEDVLESEDSVAVSVKHEESSTLTKMMCSYIVGCDGAWSSVRKSLGVEMEGGPMHRAVALTHFKSKDLAKLHSQGPFWHTFFPTNPIAHNGSVGGAIIAQDGKETWTVHDYLGSDYNPDDVKAEKTVARVLGGMGAPYPITIDEVTATSIFTPTVSLANEWSGKHQRAFLAGDACHQTIPSGGYGMNLGLADAWDLGWKLAATLQGWGGPELLASYETERRPVAALMQKWSKIHMMKLLGLSTAVELDAELINSLDERGASLRSRIDKYIQDNDDHNQSFGVEMGYQYESNVLIVDEGSQTAPAFDSRNYTPTTFPGYRVPHVFLSDGTAIFDHFGIGFTLIVFSEKSQSPREIIDFENAAKQQNVPLEIVVLVGEEHARRIWDACLVLVRPDGVSAWQSKTFDRSFNACQILQQAIGYKGR